MLLNLAAAPSSCEAVRDAGIAMVLQSLIHSVAAALSSRSGRRSPRSQREVGALFSGDTNINYISKPGFSRANREHVC